MCLISSNGISKCTPVHTGNVGSFCASNYYCGESLYVCPFLPSPPNLLSPHYPFALLVFSCIANIPKQCNTKINQCKVQISTMLPCLFSSAKCAENEYFFTSLSIPLFLISSSHHLPFPLSYPTLLSMIFCHATALSTLPSFCHFFIFFNYPFSIIFYLFYYFLLRHMYTFFNMECIQN